MARNYKTKRLKNYSQVQMDEALECLNNHNERPSDVLKKFPSIPKTTFFNNLEKKEQWVDQDTYLTKKRKDL